MKKFAPILFAICFLLLCNNLRAQLVVGSYTETRQLYKEYQGFFKQKDYLSASVALAQALKKEPNNVVFLKDLSLCYMLLGNYDKAIGSIEYALKKEDADVSCYQLAVQIYTDIKDVKAAKKTIQNGLSRFPNSGEMWHTKAQFHYNQKEYGEALESWEKGIEVDPTYHENYYYAAKMNIKNPEEYVKSLLFSEMFINLESYSARSEEMKRVLYDSYVKLIYYLKSDTNKQVKLLNPLNSFSSAIILTYNDLKDIVNAKVDVNNLTQLRVRFLLDWNKTYDELYPFELFNFHNSLLTSGNFEAYNQWLLGKESSAVVFKDWAMKNGPYLDAYTKFVEQNKIKPIAEQFYFKK